MKYVKGSISIYFTFCIVLIISIVLSITELARYNCQKFYMQIACDSGVDSMLSLYHRKLYDYYSIYGVEYRTKEMLTTEYLSYVRPYFVDEENGKKINNWYQGHIEEEKTNMEIKTLIDETNLEKEILDYMKYKIVGKVIEYFGKQIEINDKNDISKLLEEARNIYDEVDKSSIYGEIHERYFDFNDDIEKIESYAKGLKKCIKDANRAVDDLSNISTGGSLSNAKSVIKKINDFKEKIDEFIEDLEKYIERIDIFKTHINENRSRYEADKISGIYDIDEDVDSFAESEFDRFLSYVDENEGMIRNINERKDDFINLKTKVDEDKRIVDEFMDDLDSIEDEIKEAKKAKGEDYDSDYIKDLNQEKKDTEKDLEDYFKEIKRDYKDIEIEDIDLDVSTESHDTEKNALEKLVGYKNSLLLDLVMDSDKRESITNVNNHYNMFSLMSNNQNISLDKLLLTEYELDKFNYYNKELNNETTKSNSKNLEVERLISGKNSDLENIKATVNKIFKIRLIINLLHIYKDSAKREEARAFAYTVFAGFSRLLAEIMFITIITAWGSAQSILDIKRLLKNHKVNFLHTDVSWGINLSSLIDVAIHGVSETGEGDDSGSAISYKDYLRLMLISERQSEINGRMASIMESNIKKEQDNFDFEKMVISFDVDNEFLCSHFFTNMMIVSANDIKLNDEYVIKTHGFKSFVK